MTKFITNSLFFSSFCHVQDLSSANCSSGGFHPFPTFVQNKTGFTGSCYSYTLKVNVTTSHSKSLSSPEWELKGNGTKRAYTHMLDRSWHRQARLSPLHVVMHFVSLMPWQRTLAGCRVITCTPQWIMCEHGRSTKDRKHQHLWKATKEVGYFIYMWSMTWSARLKWFSELTFSASLYCLSSSVPYPPLHVIISSESMLESTRAPFAMTYGEQGRDCKRVALSGTVT